MLKLAFSRIMSKKHRTILTSLGICIATIMCLIGLYYFYINNTVANLNLTKFMADFRILPLQVTVCGENYYDDGSDGMIKEMVPINEGVVKYITGYDGVQSIKSQYLLDKPLKIKIGKSDREYVIEEPTAVDPTYSIFSQALVDLIQSQDKDFSPIIAGRTIGPRDHQVALMSEATMRCLYMQPDDIIGKKVKVYNTTSDHSTEVEVIGIYSNALSGYYRENIDELVEIQKEHNSPLLAIEIELLFSKDVFASFYTSSEFPTPLPTYVYATFDTPANIEAFTNDISNNYWIGCLSDYVMYYSTIEQQSKNTMLFLYLGIIILILSSLMVATTLIINISEQQELVEMLRLTGFTRFSIYKQFIYQSAFYGVLGGAFGVLIGYFICLIMGLSLISISGQYIQNTGIFLLPWYYVPIALLFDALLCVAIGLIVSATQNLSRKKEAQNGERFLLIS